MEEIGLIRDLAVVWLIAFFAGAICAKLRTPAMVGYIAAGVFLGPSGARLIENVEHIRVLSEIGVALLLFTLGVELSLRHIFASAHRTVLAGLLQMVITTVAAAALSLGLRISDGFGPALLFGFVAALSSTAMVTKILVDRGEAETSHARLLIAMLLFQDLSLIPVVALLPALSPQAGDPGSALLIAGAKAALLVVLVLAGSTIVIPRVLDSVVKTNSRELFVLTVMSICLGVAVISSQLGVSLALGAFLGGIMVSERPYGQQVLADILPLRDLFATLFFVSIGLMLNPQYITDYPLQVTALALFLLFGKSLLAALAARVATKATWTAVLTGFGLGQAGEFSLVVATLGRSWGLMSESAYNLFLSASIISLFLSPALITILPKVVARLMDRDTTFGTISQNPADVATGLRGHLVLCGFGRIGRNIGLSLASYGIPVVVVDVNAEVAEELQMLGIRHVYGDAFSRAVLSRAGVENADCVVVAIPDPVIALNIINVVRASNPNAKIVVRAHHIEDADGLKAAGASAIVQPEFEASVELLKLSMVAMKRSRAEIELASKDMRRYAHLLFQPDLTTRETI